MQTFPRAMLLAIVIVSLSYLLPLAVATGALPRAKYCDGCFVSIANELAGPWLGTWITVSAAVSCFGQGIAEMASDSFLLMGMADNGQLPKFLSQRSRFGTPTVGVLFSALGVVITSQLDFVAIVELVNILYCFSEWLEFAAFIKLRQDREGERPWQIPWIRTPTHAMLFFSIPTVFLCLILAFASPLGWVIAVIAIGATTFGYILQCVLRGRRALDYNSVQGEFIPTSNYVCFCLVCREIVGLFNIFRSLH